MKNLINPHYDNILPVLMMFSKQSHEQTLMLSTYATIRDSQIAALEYAYKVLEDNDIEKSKEILLNSIDELKRQRFDK